MSTGNRAYLRAVDERIAEVFDEAITWANLLTTMQGADPVLVAQRLVALDLTPRPGRQEWVPTRWTPELHPADAEWYFTPQCAASLARRIGGDRLLGLGAPTVVASRPGAVAIESDASVARRRLGTSLGAVVECDLGCATELGITGDTAVVDPPWYPPHPQRWLLLAARAVGVGGRIAMVVPPRLQRASAAEHRRETLAWGRQLGPTTLHSGAVAYSTPAFEFLAMRAAGIWVPPQWRTADLMQVEVRHLPSDPLPAPAALPTFDIVTLGEQRVAIRREEDDDDLQLLPVEGTSGFRWDRVTRRDPRLSAIGLWTSRSRVAAVRGYPTLRRVLRELRGGATVAKAVADPRIRETLTTILEL